MVERKDSEHLEQRVCCLRIALSFDGSKDAKKATKKEKNYNKEKNIL